MHVEKSVVAAPQDGLHARPAAEFVVKKAQQFASDKGDEEQPGGQREEFTKIMTLGAKKGDEIVIRAEGDDAEEAVDARSNSSRRTSASPRAPKTRHPGKAENEGPGLLLWQAETKGCASWAKKTRVSP